MKRKKLLFVMNPKAGKAQVKGHLLAIIDTFIKGGYDVTTYVTQSAKDAQRAVREREDCDMIVCCGGDGTLDEVVTGMVESGEQVPIGYIPAGSTNDFAGSLKIPKNMLKAAKIVTEGKIFSCDIGSFNRDVFVYVAAFGMFTDVSYETTQEMKNLLGHSAYVLECMKRLAAVKSFHMRFEYENGVIEDDFLLGMVTNSLSVGGFKGITGKNVSLNDGELEVLLIRRPQNPIELNMIVASLLDGSLKCDRITSFKTSNLVVKSKRPVAWTLDGEYGGSHREVVIKDHREVLRIMVPDEKKTQIKKVP